MASSVTPEMTVSAAVRSIAGVLRAAGFEDGERDARFLVQGFANVSAAALIAHPERVLGAAAHALNLGLERRLLHEPVSRILGWREFFGRRFEVTPEVLDPRPETETLISAALELAAQKNWHQRAITIADIGTGSGILIATLLLELPNARGIATDISAAALEVAKRNVEALGLAPARVSFVHGRGLAGLRPPIDLVVSNPPYIPSAIIHTLDAAVRNYDPLDALDGGLDGLAVYRELADEIAARQHKNGTTVLVEIGVGQANEITKIFDDRGGAAIGQYRDLGRHIRGLGFELKNDAIGEL